MANLYTGTHTFTGYKALDELTSLTFETNTKYTIQVILPNTEFYVREGTDGKGFIKDDATPFEWTCNGEDDLYIGLNSENTIYINVSN